MRKKNNQLDLRQLFRYVFLTGLLIFQTSCKDEFSEFQNEEVIKKEKIAARNLNGDLILENPYSVRNMIRAYAELATNGDRATAEAISGIGASHYYVEIRANRENIDVLRSDSTLILYPYRLDVEISDSTDIRNNSEFDFSDKTETFYASIPVNYRLPIDDYTILEELYIPDEVKLDSQGNTSLSTVAKPNRVSVDDLVNKSLELTGNVESSTVARGSWRPGGRITMQDTQLGTVGVEGLKIQARRWFTTHTGFVDQNGYYQCDGTFKNPANYSFNFERYEFEIRGSISGVDGPKTEGNWNQNYQRNTKENYHSNIFRAAFHYCYKDILSLRRPPENGFWKTQLKIQANYFNDPDGEILGSHNPSRRFLGMGSAIHIYQPTGPSQQIYATTIHEIAHASHWNMDRSNYNNGDLIVVESWARGVQWALTRTVYPSYQPSYIRGSYTGVVQDMVDGIKTVSSYYYQTPNSAPEYVFSTYKDQAFGYIINKIEDALIGNRQMLGWKNKIRSTPGIVPSGTIAKDYIDVTFQYWQTR